MIKYLIIVLIIPFIIGCNKVPESTVSVGAEFVVDKLFTHTAVVDYFLS